MPNFFLNSSTVVAMTGAEPICILFSLMSFLAAAYSSSRFNWSKRIDCTIDVMVAPVFAICCQKCELEYAGGIAMEPPASNVERQKVVELMWGSGRFTRNRSFSVMRSHSRMLSALTIRLLRESLAPLGWAVVPEVNRTSASWERPDSQEIFTC